MAISDKQKMAAFGFEEPVLIEHWGRISQMERELEMASVIADYKGVIANLGPDDEEYYVECLTQMSCLEELKKLDDHDWKIIGKMVGDYEEELAYEKGIGH